MNEREYQLVDKSGNPDLGINVTKIVSTQTGLVSYPSYWDYYNSYWDPYYWGYSGYDYYFPYASYVVYQVREGALSVDLIDLKDASGDKTIKGVEWCYKSPRHF